MRYREAVEIERGEERRILFSLDEEGQMKLLDEIVLFSNLKFER